MSVIFVYKQPGEGLNELLERVRHEDTALESKVITYAGRLDPLAEGVVLILSGEDRFEKEKYLGLSKEYEVTVLFGVETDTGDPLGLVTQILPNISLQNMSKAVSELTQITEWQYPSYSSKTFAGKPSFVWAREGKSHTVPPMFKKAKILSTKMSGAFQKVGSEILIEVEEKVSRVRGDFRQEEVIASWNRSLDNFKDAEFRLVTLTIECESGVYMREVARVLGEKLGTVAIAYHIKRTKVGPCDSIKERELLT